MYKLPEDFAGGAVVKHPPASAGEHKFDPWPWKTPHAMWPLSPSTTAAEPTLWTPGSATGAAPALQPESSSLARPN